MEQQLRAHRKRDSEAHKGTRGREVRCSRDWENAISPSLWTPVSQGCAELILGGMYNWNYVHRLILSASILSNSSLLVHQSTKACTVVRIPHKFVYPCLIFQTTLHEPDVPLPAVSSLFAFDLDILFLVLFGIRGPLLSLPFCRR